MTYQETLDFLFSQLPMYQRVGASAYKKDLGNIVELCTFLGEPQKKFKSIHIAGTNGKGSTAHMLASVFQSGGYKTGLYTSPHLKNFTERIKVNGVEISKNYVVDFVARVKPIIEKIHPSFFELTVAMAFDYYAEELVDIAIIEVGLGGRLDSTNIITPELSIITNISLDHVHMLGDSVDKIALEKAGIIKKRIPVIIGEWEEESAEVFMEVAESQEAPLFFASAHYDVADAELVDGLLAVTLEDEDEEKSVAYSLDLNGQYQANNLPAVLVGVDLVNEMGFNLPKSAVINGLQKVIELTGLKGRWQKLQDLPLVICDTGHNLAGIGHILDQITNIPHENLHMVLGMVDDKSIGGILELLPKTGLYYWCQANVPRAMNASILAQSAEKFELNGVVIPSVTQALIEAKKRSQADDLIFVGGSTFVVAELDL